MIKSEQKRLGEEASKILNNPMIKDFITAAREKYHNAIEASAYDQDDVRMDAYLKLNALSDLVTTLEHYIKLGEIQDKPIVNRLKSLD